MSAAPDDKLLTSLEAATKAAEAAAEAAAVTKAEAQAIRERQDEMDALARRTGAVTDRILSQRWTFALAGFLIMVGVILLLVITTDGRQQRTLLVECNVPGPTHDCYNATIDRTHDAVRTVNDVVIWAIECQNEVPTSQLRACVTAKADAADAAPSGK